MVGWRNRNSRNEKDGKRQRESERAENEEEEKSVAGTLEIALDMNNDDSPMAKIASSAPAKVMENCQPNRQLKLKAEQAPL